MNNKPVRIAQVIGIMRNGGVEAVVFNYYKHIDRSKILYDFIITEDSLDRHEDTIKSLDGRIFIVPSYKKQFAFQRALYELFRQNHYPLVYSHMNTLSVFTLFAAWRAGVPIRAAHNHATAGRGEFKRNIMKYTLRPFSKVFPTHLCACSRLAGEWLFGKRTMDSGRVKIWQNAIETERFAYSEQKRNDTRKALNLEGKYVVGHVGRFMTQKNHKFLIDIFSEIHKRRSDSMLLLVGIGPLMDEVKAKIHSLGLDDSVIFIGSVRNSEDYYQAMDIFILPSLYEGLPVVGSEAQVSGLPMLCADTITSETKFCDDVSFMSLSKSASEWAEEALSLSDNHIRRDMSSYAREAGFDIKAQAVKMTEWYCKLLGI